MGLHEPGSEKGIEGEREAGMINQSEEIDPEQVFKDYFNTQLTPEEELKFIKWVTKESKKSKRDILMDLGAYDVRGYWKSNDWKITDPSGRGHGPDTWKKPNHPTFSNESIYHGTILPNGERAIGGTWGENTFTPGRTNLKYHGLGGLTKYFEQIEPETKIVIPRW